MLVQDLINWVVGLVADFWSVIPPMPSGFASVLSTIEDFELWARGHLYILGVIIPWDTIQLLGGLVVIFWGFWALFQIPKITLWIAGRS